MGTAWVPAGLWTGEPQRDGKGGGGRVRRHSEGSEHTAVPECRGRPPMFALHSP